MPLFIPSEEPLEGECRDRSNQDYDSVMVRLGGTLKQDATDLTGVAEVILNHLKFVVCLSNLTTPYLPPSVCPTLAVLLLLFGYVKLHCSVSSHGLINTAKHYGTNANHLCFSFAQQWGSSWILNCIAAFVPRRFMGGSHNTVRY